MLLLGLKQPKPYSNAFAREVGGPTVPVLLGFASARKDAAQVSVKP